MIQSLKQIFSKQYSLLLASIIFSVVMVAIRVIMVDSYFGLFLVWNLFLAGLPLFFALWLQHVRGNHGNPLVQMLLFTAWLLFFPNAMYIITDLFHLKTRWPVPQWFDTILLFSAALNGLLLGFNSLSIVQRIFSDMFNKTVGILLSIGCLFLAGYGIFLGRYLRWNSWDVLSNPFSLVGDIAHHVLRPHHHLFMYGFVLLFGSFMCVAYFAMQRNTIVSQVKKVG
ncbi:DUF1361 domain-containing protein [soil metagenome]